MFCVPLNEIKEKKNFVVLKERQEEEIGLTFEYLFAKHAKQMVCGFNLFFIIYLLFFTLSSSTPLNSRHIQMTDWLASIAHRRT